MRTSLRSKKIENYRKIKSEKMDTDLLYNKYYSNQSVLFDNIYDNIIIDNIVPINLGTKNIIMNVRNNTSITTGKNNIILGISAGGNIGEGENNILMGQIAGLGNIFNKRNIIGIGPSSIQSTGTAGNGGISIGYETNSPGSNSIYIGCNAGGNATSDSIAIGSDSAKNTTSNKTISLGVFSGNINQGSNSIAIGFESARDTQKQRSISIGNKSGASNQNSNSVAIGTEAGFNQQGSNSIAIGNLCGSNNQGDYSIALGSGNIANNNQGNNAIAIGSFSNASENQGENCISIGNSTLKTIVNPTTNSFFMGTELTTNLNTPTGVFAVNTTENTFSPTNSTNTTGGLFINGCIRALDIESNSASNGVLYYNPITYEVNYNSS